MCKISKKPLKLIQNYDDRPFIGQKWSTCPKQAFFFRWGWGESLLFSSAYWRISLCKSLKNSYNRPKILKMRHFWIQIGSICPKNFFFWENLLINLLCMPVYIPKVRHKSVNEILTIKEYWNLADREPYLLITWEPDFSQACSFLKMLKDRNNFHFTPTPDKPNNLIFLKSPKNLVFWPFLTIFWPNFFQKNPALTHVTEYEPLASY